MPGAGFDAAAGGITYRGQTDLRVCWRRSAVSDPESGLATLVYALYGQSGRRLVFSNASDDTLQDNADERCHQLAAVPYEKYRAELRAVNGAGASATEEVQRPLTASAHVSMSLP